MNNEKFDSLWSPVEGCPAQNRDELFWLVNKVESINPEIIIEIGVARGGTLRYWEQLVPKGGTVIGIDKDLKILKQIEEWWDYHNSDRNLHLIIRDSLNEVTIKQVKQILSGRQADFLFINGHHDPEYVFREFVTYGALVRYGGLIGFHDIRPEMNLQHVFNKIAGHTERFLVNLGIGIYWKEPLKHSIIFNRSDGKDYLLDLDPPQTERLKGIWGMLKMDRWGE